MTLDRRIIDTSFAPVDAYILKPHFFAVYTSAIWLTVASRSHCRLHYSQVNQPVSMLPHARPHHTENTHRGPSQSALTHTLFLGHVHTIFYNAKFRRIFSTKGSSHGPRHEPVILASVPLHADLRCTHWTMLPVDQNTALD